MNTSNYIFNWIIYLIFIIGGGTWMVFDTALGILLMGCGIFPVLQTLDKKYKIFKNIDDKLRKIR